MVSLCGAPVISFRLIQILHQSAAPFLVQQTNLVHGSWIALLRSFEEKLRGLSLVDRPSLARQMHRSERDEREHVAVVGRLFVPFGSRLGINRDA